MNDFVTITCDRGDRAQFLEHCKWQLSRMTIQPAKSYFIDYPPKSLQKDLVERMKVGIDLAKKDGFDKVYVIESDDFYSPDYFERMAFLDCDFVGDDSTTYFHLKNQGYQYEKHINRASLFTTGFRISAIEKMQWPEPNNVWLDIALWGHAQRRYKRRFTPSGCIGIKHSVGLTGGIGHREGLYRKFDKDFEWLSQRVDKTSLEFYMNFNKQYA